MRLIGAEGNASEGRLELKYDGIWGTVCDEGFTDIAAKVACNGLGFGYVEKNALQSLHRVITDRNLCNMQYRAYVM